MQIQMRRDVKYLNGTIETKKGVTIENNGKTASGVDIEARKRDYQTCLEIEDMNKQQTCMEELVARAAGDNHDGLTYCSKPKSESVLNTKKHDKDGSDVWESAKVLC